jgi:HEAT repeat protein
MRRTLILALAIAGLLAGVFLSTFAFSRHNVKGQGFLTSLSDFVFMIDSYVRATFDVKSRPPREQDIESAVERLRPTAHNEVKWRVVWWFGQWGEVAAPRLAQEFERADERRKGWLARSLGETRSPQAVAPLRGYLDGWRGPERPRSRREVSDALARIGTDEAVKVLIGFHRRACRDCDEVLQAIATVRTPTSTNYVLEAFNRKSPRAPAHDYTWALARTRDERGARALAQLLRHPEYYTRVSARSAAHQEMGREALEPFLDALLAGPDDYVRYDALDVLSRVAGREPHARLIAALAPLLDHSTFSHRAYEILARMRAPEVIAALKQDAASIDPDLIALLGAAAKPIIEERLESPDPRVRANTVWLLRRLYLPHEKEVLVWARRFHYKDPDIHWARPLVEARLLDPDARVRRAAEENLRRLDRAMLLASFAESTPERFGRGAWYNAAPPHRDGFNTVFHVLTGVHVAGLVMSFVLGLRFLFNGLRIFEPYRFNLFIQFLLAEGFVGDFFFLPDHGPYYLAATAVHLLLLTGFLSKESERLPNQPRNRFERLGGASLWVVAPLVLYLGTPLLAEGLRLTLRSFPDVWPHLVVLALLSALMFEQAIWSSDLFRRPAWFERILGFVLSVAVLALPIQALLRLNAAREAAEDADGAALALFLLLPLAWTLLLHAWHARIHETVFLSRRIAAPPGDCMHVTVDGRTVTVLFLPRTPRKSKLIQNLLKIVLIGGVGLAAAVVAGRDGKVDSMLLALIGGFAGAAMAGLLIQVFRRRILLQIRDRFVRTADTTFGGVGHAAPWQRRPMFRASARAWLFRRRFDRMSNPEQPLDPAEWKWVAGVLAGGDGAEASAHALSPHAVRLSARPRAGSPGDANLLAVELQIENRSDAPLMVGALEPPRGGSAWRAEVDGDAADLFLAREERERLIAPGGAVVCRGRIFPGKTLSGKEKVLVRLGCGEIHSEPFWYALSARGSHA